MKRKELKILGLSYSQSQIGSYVCVLSEKRGNRKIPLIIKTPEAQKIALELEGIKSPRTLIHDLIKNICDSYGVDVQEVFIYSLLEGIFYTKILLSNGIETVELECPSGDALALSVIFKCPIYVTGEILNTAGILINDDGTIINDTDDSYSNDEIDSDDDGDEFYDYLDDNKKERVVSVDDLEIMMNNAIQNEEYEIAAELRDRIQKLKNV